MKAVAALALMALLCACGQKGPLYFAPEPEAAAEQAAPAPAQENNDDTQD